VGGEQFHADNHFVPSVYLRHFGNNRSKVSVYRTLVPHARVHLWDDRSSQAIAYIRHLYTRVAAGRETDEVETWLDREFEHPVAEALDRAVSDLKLTPDHWRRLIRFTAAQMVRTPANWVLGPPVDRHEQPNIWPITIAYSRATGT
jgi:hypothetical protein